jgi:protein-S-isoprenylcysteine O-methyltransferase Ste14
MAWLMDFVRRAEWIFWSFVAFIVFITATVIILDRGYIWPLFDFGDWLLYLGILLMAAGYSLRRYAIWVLGRAFSNILCIKEGQTLTCTGLYARVRHPAYTGTLVAVAGIPFIFSSPIGLLPISLAVAAVLYRIKVEERMLTEKFGQEYAEYVNRTKMLVPGLL